LLALYETECPLPCSKYPATSADTQTYESGPGYLVISLSDPPECLEYRKESREEGDREGTPNYVRKDRVFTALALIYYKFRTTMRRHLV